MATSGKRRFGLAASLAAAVVLAATAGPSAGVGGKASWCKARSSATWRRLLARHVVAVSRTTALVPLAIAHDSRSFFADVYSPRFSGVARVDARTSVVRRIKAFPDPELDQAWGAFDGRWLVWNEYHGFDNFNDFTTWAWDAQSAKLIQLGAATRGSDGQFWESPWHGADVRHGIAAWVQGIGPDQLAEVHTFDLRSGRELVVRHGHPGGAFLLDRHLLVWTEASAPGVATTMHAASALTGATVRVPQAVRGLRNVTGLQTDGDRIAYPDASYKSLWWSPSLRRKPHKVVGTGGYDHVDNSVQVGARYVGFGIQPRVFVADTSAHRYVQISDHGGWTRLDDTALLVVYASRHKALHPLERIAFVRLRDLPPLPPCS